MNSLSFKFQKSKSILQSVINSAFDAVIISDSNGRITEWNYQAENIFLWKRAEILGQLLPEIIIPLNHRSVYTEKISHFFNHSKALAFDKRFEITAVNKRKTQFPIELTIIPKKIDGDYLFIYFIRDLKETKRSQVTLNAINKLAISLLGKNELEEIAWEITQNTIELLGLEDCVIYILDSAKDQLNQIAAYGPKNPDGKRIENEISLKVGQGIVGRAAATKKPVLVNDTSLDKAYVVDDDFRFSELAVPIVYEGNVIGVIDSEHHQRNFYQKEHLEAFTTIANLTSSKINSAINSRKRKEVEISLKESEERWQNLVENMPEALQISVEGRVVYMNPAALRLYEANNMEQMMGKDLRGFLLNVNSNFIEDRLAILQKKGFIEPTEFQIKTVKGNVKHIEANSNTILYNGAYAIQTVLRDITEKKKSERELIQLSSRLSTLLNNLNTGVLMEQSDRVIVHANDKFCDLFGNAFEPSDLMGRDYVASLEQVKGYFEEPDQFVASTIKLGQENKRSVNEELELMNGRILERDYIPIIYGGVQYGTVWQYRDITDRKKSEKELLRALESERSYNELNKNFVSMVSHEFRTPLTSIFSTAELLLEFSDSYGPADIKKRVGRIHASSIRMENLIEDVLTIGKLDSTQVIENMQKFKLSEVLDDTIKMLRSMGFKDREIHVSGMEYERLMYSDLSLVELIFRNLLENACKYSESGIDFKFEFTSEQVHIECVDYGIGIPQQELNLIFEPFKRASNTEGVKGTGLGLPIVKKSVEKIGGKIWVESEQGKGSKFKVELPLAASYF